MSSGAFILAVAIEYSTGFARKLTNFCQKVDQFFAKIDQVWPKVDQIPRKLTRFHQKLTKTPGSTIFAASFAVPALLASPALYGYNRSLQM